MKLDGNQIRPGHVLRHRDQLWRVMSVEHVKPGKGGAFAQAELRNLRSGAKFNARFRASESVERVRLAQLPYQYLYRDGEAYCFMNQETFEQISLSEPVLGAEQIPYLQEGLVVTLETMEAEEAEILSLSLPEHATLAVTETEAVVRGQTATASYKPAVLENGIRLTVPPHIETGMRIVVHTASGSYVERAKL